MNILNFTPLLIFTSIFSVGSYADEKIGASKEPVQSEQTVNTILDFNLEAPPGLISSEHGNKEKVYAYWYNSDSYQWMSYPEGTTDDETDIKPITNGNIRSYHLAFSHSPDSYTTNYIYMSISTLGEACTYFGEYLNRYGKKYYVEITNKKGTKSPGYRTVNDFSVCTYDNVLTLKLKPIVNGYLLPYVLYSYDYNQNFRTTGQKGYIPLSSED